MAEASGSRLAGWVVVASWLLGSAALTLGFEQVSSEGAAVAAFSCACALWLWGHKKLLGCSTAARVASFVGPAGWAAMLVGLLAMDVDLRYWDWLLAVMACILGVTLGIGVFSESRRRGTLKGDR